MSTLSNLESRSFTGDAEKTFHKEFSPLIRAEFVSKDPLFTSLKAREHNINISRIVVETPGRAQSSSSGTSASASSSSFVSSPV